METSFTPWASLGGGVLIGVAAVLLMALHGRVLGATGILSGLLRFDDREGWAVRAALLLGMLAGPALHLTLTGGWPEIEVPVSGAMLVGGGFLVGVGAGSRGSRRAPSPRRSRSWPRPSRPCSRSDT